MIQNYKELVIQDKHIIVYFEDGTSNLCVEIGRMTSLRKLIKAFCRESNIDFSKIKIDTIILRRGTFRAILYLGDKRLIVALEFKKLKIEFELFTAQLMKKIKPKTNEQ